MKPRRTLRRFVPLLLVLVGIPAQAGGPLYVGGPGAAAGIPYRWNINPVTYWTDQGNLGTQTTAQADDLVAQAFKVWQDVPTASISFSAAGKLSDDVTAANVMEVQNALNNCSVPLGSTSVAQDRTIIYDVDGSAFKALGEDPTTTLGFADAFCFASDGINNSFSRGEAVLNGLFIDGKPDTSANPEVTVDEFRAAFIHEFGHMIGLDHSQINLNCLTSSCAPDSDDLQGVPTMFPVLISVEMATLSTDDIAAISELYPETTSNPPTQVPFASTTGRITGHVLFSDGVTAAQGFNVIARNVSSPRATAVSSVSGFLFTADAGNPFFFGSAFGSPSQFGSRTPALVGFYNIPGLPPGSYTVEVEAINNSGDNPFVGGSSVGPIGTLGFQFPMPGTCTREFHNAAESANDLCDDQTPVTVNAGEVQTDIDITLNGTRPRFDAWEGGP